MEDVTDQPFRVICKELGADVLVTEFTSVEALIRNVKKAAHRIKVLEEERPVGVQIFGFNEDSFSKAVEIVVQQKPDFIDINSMEKKRRSSSSVRVFPAFGKIRRRRIYP